MNLITEREGEILSRYANWTSVPEVHDLQTPEISGTFAEVASCNGDYGGDLGEGDDGGNGDYGGGSEGGDDGGNGDYGGGGDN